MASATPAMLPMPTGGRERGGQRLKVRDITLVVGIVVLPRRHGDPVPQTAHLHETEAEA